MTGTGVLHVVGMGRSGSTLLGLIAGAQPGWTMLGEWIHYCVLNMSANDHDLFIALRRQRYASGIYRAYCRSCGGMCPFIKEHSSLTLRDHYQQVRKLFGVTGWLIDTSKNPGYTSIMQTCNPDEQHIRVLVHKPPWAYARSLVGENAADSDVALWAANWAANVIALSASAPDHVLAYEDLATDASHAMPRIMGLKSSETTKILTVPAEDYGEKRQHHIGGNVHTLRNAILAGTVDRNPWSGNDVDGLPGIRGVRVDPNVANPIQRYVEICYGDPCVHEAMSLVGRTWP